MEDYKLGEIERRFADLIWDHEPLSSGSLVQLCAQRLDWKKSTAYTVLRKLCAKGLFENQGGQAQGETPPETANPTAGAGAVWRRFPAGAEEKVGGIRPAAG